MSPIEVGPPDPALPTIIEGGAAQIAKLIEGEDSDRFVGRCIQELNETVVGAVGEAPDATIDPRDASIYLDSSIEAAAEVIRARCAAYAPLRWLWYLRRTPRHLFVGNHPTTFGYDSALAESLTWLLSSSDSRVSGEEPLRFPIDTGVCRHILRLVAGTKYLSQLHVFARYAGKGASFTGTRQMVPLVVVPDSVRESAIATYDKRLVDQNAHFHAGLGLAPVKLIGDTGEDGDLKVYLITRCAPHPMRCELPGPAGQLVNGNITVRWMPEVLPIRRLILPYGEVLADDMYPTEQAISLLMLATIWPLFYVYPWCIGSILQHGYFVVSEPLALEVLRRALPTMQAELKSAGYTSNVPADAETWLRSLESTPPSLWPPVRGGVVRRRGALIALDVGAASEATIHFFRARRLSGTAGNQRGRQFERDVRNAIEGTSWKPRERLAALAGRTLRRKDGSAITDADAIGEQGRLLLIVSCKSVIYDAAYDAGQFAAIRNIRQTVSDAVQSWKEKITELTAMRVGDNYDFSDFDEILGVVCTPFAPYTDDAAALEFVRPGLRAASSATELASWLRLERVHSVATSL